MLVLNVETLFDVFHRSLTNANVIVPYIYSFKTYTIIISCITNIILIFNIAITNGYIPTNQKQILMI